MALGDLTRFKRLLAFFGKSNLSSFGGSHSFRAHRLSHLLGARCPDHSPQSYTLGNGLDSLSNPGDDSPMRNKRRKLIAVVLLALAALVACVLVFPNREPAWQGRTLSGWLKDFDANKPKAGRAPRRQSAKSARTFSPSSSSSSSTGTHGQAPRSLP